MWIKDEAGDIKGIKVKMKINPESKQRHEKMQKAFKVK